MTQSSTRETILAALASSLTSALVAEYGAGRAATRDLSIDAAQVQPEQTPRILIIEGTRTVSSESETGQVPAYDLTLQILGLIRRDTSAQAANLQTEGNYLEAFLDRTLAAIGALGDHAVSIHQRTSNTSTVAAGDGEVWVVYDTTLRYWEPYS